MTTQAGTQALSAVLNVGEASYRYYPVSSIAGFESLPYSLTVLLENVLRTAASLEDAQDLAERIVSAGLSGKTGSEIEFSPARVLFQDFTGVPVFTDFAVMREACAELGGDPARINPQIPCDLVIDHSVIADQAGCAGALAVNVEREYQRNTERYKFLKWAQNSFENVRIVPPGVGICHQLNIEQFARVVVGASATENKQMKVDKNGASSQGEKKISQLLPLAYFDTLVGTDSHTPTANGIGVLGWGVGGIEAEAAALGQPITTLVPQVVGVKLTGALQPGVSAMDVALTFAATLRAKGVVGCFVECFGEGVSHLSATQRSCIANMTPEYGCTCTLFPVDEQTIAYLRLTGRSAEQVALVETYAKAQGFWHDVAAAPRHYASVVELDLSSITPMVAGPTRPHDGIALNTMYEKFHKICDERVLDSAKTVSVSLGGSSYELTHGALAIAAVTSCTTATDPSMMIAAGLMARNAAEKGLRSKPWVKTILAPGSHAIELLLERAGLLSGLESLGFYLCGFGCMSCIGNSGPLLPELHEIANDIELASVLSGNRNFEGRISPDVSQNYLATPAVVVAYSLVGTMDFDLTHEALGMDKDGNAVYLADIWPSDCEIAELVERFATADLYREVSRDLYKGGKAWDALDVEPSLIFSWDDNSIYVRRPPYFEGMTFEPNVPDALEKAHVLARLGDFITTDHISPAGAIAQDSPAADYLKSYGIEPQDFNTYGARRGNHEVMMRGTFANVKLTNLLAGGKKGGWTYDFISGGISPLFYASERACNEGLPLVVLAGKMYGSGSSRDWAAKGPLLLGVRAVFAESFERIHRSNLIGMGILPLQFLEGESVAMLGLDGTECYSIDAIDFSAGLPQPSIVSVTAEKEDGSVVMFQAVVRIDTPTEGRYYAHGGILPFVLRNLTKE